jgi:hypothetical protein
MNGLCTFLAISTQFFSSLAESVACFKIPQSGVACVSFGSHYGKNDACGSCHKFCMARKFAELVIFFIFYFFISFIFCEVVVVVVVVAFPVEELVPLDGFAFQDQLGLCPERWDVTV